jgi:hypothetical protein
MSSGQLQPVEIDCDAPPYAIVRACGKLGFHAAEDVRWCHVDNIGKGKGCRPNIFNLRAWVLLFRGQRTTSCACTRKLPALESCTFTMLSGREVRLLLGQCPRCHTIYWKQA